MAEKSGIELSLYSIPPKPEKGPEGLAGAILASKTWSVMPKPGFHKYSLREWMHVRALHVDSTNTYRSRNDVIRQVADKNAVHYDEDIGEIVDSMRRTFGSKYANGLQFFLVDTSAAIVYLGARFIRLKKLIAEGTDVPEAHDAITSLDAEFEALKISLI